MYTNLFYKRSSDSEWVIRINIYVWKEGKYIISTHINENMSTYKNWLNEISFGDIEFRYSFLPSSTSCKHYRLFISLHIFFYSNRLVVDLSVQFFFVCKHVCCIHKLFRLQNRWAIHGGTSAKYNLFYMHMITMIPHNNNRNM